MSEKIEGRKRLNFGARFIITMFIVATFLILVWLIFYVELPQASRDLINIMVGAYVAVLAKSTDYWFKEKDDPEHKLNAQSAKHKPNTECIMASGRARGICSQRRANALARAFSRGKAGRSAPTKHEARVGARTAQLPRQDANKTRQTQT